MPDKNLDIKGTVRQYIFENHLGGELSQSLQDTTPLITSGLIDSIGVLSLINFLERRFAVEFTPREIGLHDLETVERIHQAIHRKLESKGAL